MMQPMQLFTSTLLICWAVFYAQAQRGGAFSTLATPEPTSGSSSSRFAQQQSSIAAVSSSGVATGAPLAETATPSTAGMPKWQSLAATRSCHMVVPSLPLLKRV